MTSDAKKFLARLLAAGALIGAWAFPPPPARGAEAQVLDLDAAGLAPGEVNVWTNLGSLGGVFEPGPGGGPRAATVDGRPAVEFTEGRWMKSSFPAPDALAGGHAFTLSLWLRATRVHGKGTIVSWASPPKDRVEFGYGRGSDGAFLAADVRGAYRGVPKLERWNHVAFTYADGALCVYVNGELDARHEKKIAPKAGEPVRLGTAWDAAKQKAVLGYAGALARLQAWDRAMTPREVRNLSGRTTPFSPTPAAGTLIEERSTVLSWQAGHPEARAFRVQLATNAAALEGGGAVPLGGGPLATNAVETGTLAIGATCYWRVTQLDGAGATLDAGPVWSFRVSDGPAGEPQPRNRVAAVPSDTAALSWRPGRYTVTQDLFFGADTGAVARGATPLARGLPATTTRHALPAGTLRPGTTYYWRVEQHNGGLPATPGDVWSFRVEEPPVPGEVTFFVVSDTHYGMDPRGDAILPELVDMMNALPGTEYPAQAGGGPVRQPRGVVHIGDCTNDGKPDQWAAFTRDFGVAGEGRLVYPAYETFGNHDGGPANPVRQGIRERNKKRVGLTRLSENGMHYSWEWEGVHFLMLGVSIGDTFNPYDPQHSYDFLVQELKTQTRPGAPLVLFHHFGFDKGHSMNWWTDAARAKYLEVIKDRNVLGIFHGHAHRPEIYQWEGLDIFHPPHMEVHEQPSDEPAMHGIFIVRITKDELTVVQRNLDGTWGMAKRKRLSPAAAAAPAP